MDAAFWQSRWEQGLIGFHLDDVNPYLNRHWPDLALPPGAAVLVPLCGKSLDMAWLAGQGYRVRGVELSAIAVQAFFSEQGTEVRPLEEGAFMRYQAGRVEILQGDIFALPPEQAGDCLGLYDRAALIALPPELRQAYAALLNRLLPVGCKGLLVTLDYPQAAKSPPPFAVAQDEVRRLFGQCWDIQELEARDIIDDSPRFAEAGISRLMETTYRLEKLR